HAALWFSLEPGSNRTDAADVAGRDQLSVSGNWEDLFQSDQRGQLEPHLWSYLKRRPWFAGQGRTFKSVQILDAIPLDADLAKDFLLILVCEYMEGDPQRYLLPVGLATGQAAAQIQKVSPEDIVARLNLQQENLAGVIFNASRNVEFCR